MNIKYLLLAVILGGLGLYFGLAAPKPAMQAGMMQAPAMTPMPGAAPLDQVQAQTVARMQVGPQAPLLPSVPMQGFQVQEAAPVAAADPTVPPNYIPRRLKVFEGHWQGLDGRLLTNELVRKLKYPAGLQGVLLGEVTLTAANSGFLAGDVIIKVEDTPVRTVEEFQEASRQVMNRTEARLSVVRKDESRPGTVRTFSLTLRGDSPLGFVQVEGAPMIQPGDPRPHGYRGPCTDCHPVGKGLELTPDPDLINLPPPVIARETAAKGIYPHENRGPCEACHLIR